jgi:hypothetical protein
MSDTNPSSEDPVPFQLNAAQGAAASGGDNEVLLSLSTFNDDGKTFVRWEVPMTARVARGLAYQLLESANKTDAAKGLPRRPSESAQPAAKPYPPVSLMDAYYVGVGRISAAIAHLDLRISLAIWELANVQQKAGACITAQFIAPYPRLLALASLVAYRSAPQDAIDELNRLIRDIRGVAGERNRVSHDPGFLSPDADGGYQRFQITADRTLIFEMQPDALGKMQKLERDIREVTVRFNDWKVRTFAALPTFDRTQFERSDGISVGPPPDPDSERLGP